ncbi:MAG: hypothetical protein H6587_12695 [Flavobacteriales bacterium]|nr:hypothetical protein [Flavobacteriales bacterium]MCB9365422.1 hypothetical protein [Flavobacteriales bacterium]
MNNLIKNSIAGIVIIILFFIGYVREAIFLVINSVLKKYPFPYNSSYITPPKFLYNYSASNLLTIKWVLTFGFSLIFSLITLLLVNFYFKNKMFNLITVRIYLSLIIVSFLLSLIGMMFNNFDETYAISRFVIGLAQYPLLPLVLFVLFYFKSKQTNII